MEFRLTYIGPLKATQRDPKPGTNQKTKHWQLKHQIRLAMHPQLKRLWSLTRFLAEEQQLIPPKPYNVEALSKQFSSGAWSFVPLVTTKLDLITSIDVLLLRADHPGESVWSGDIENRIKTLIDALEVPTAQDGYSELTLLPANKPLYCLLESDKLLSRLSVTTDLLLDVPENADPSFAHVILTVKIRPNNLTFDNIGF